MRFNIFSASAIAAIYAAMSHSEVKATSSSALNQIDSTHHNFDDAWSTLLLAETTSTVEAEAEGVEKFS